MYHTSQIKVMFLWCVQNWFSDFSVMCILHEGLLLLHQQQTKSKYDNVCLQKMRTLVFYRWEKEKEVIRIKPESKDDKPPSKLRETRMEAKADCMCLSHSQHRFITFPSHVHHNPITASSHFHHRFVTFPSCSSHFHHMLIMFPSCVITVPSCVHQLL